MDSGCLRSESCFPPVGGRAMWNGDGSNPGAREVWWSRPQHACLCHRNGRNLSSVCIYRNYNDCPQCRVLDNIIIITCYFSYNLIEYFNIRKYTPVNVVYKNYCVVIFVC